jgi:CO/xanthine dehydrogenase Mo-binding subunit
MSDTIAVGKSIPRIDASDKVLGKAVFAGDVQLPGMSEAKLLLSPHAHAEILSIDVSQAEALPGVFAVITGVDIPQVEAYDPRSRFHAFLAHRFAVYCGHPVAAVAAVDLATAEAALDLILVEYRPLPAVIDPREAIRPGSTAVSRDTVANPDDESNQGGNSSPNIANRMVFENGDMAIALAESDVVVENTYTMPATHQGYLEPHTVVAHWDRADHVMVWECAQSPFGARDMIAETLGIPPTCITLNPVEVGGAFGGKDLGIFGPLVVLLARKAQRPVKLALTRWEEFTSANPAPYTVVHLKTGAKKDGRLTLLEGEVLIDIGAFSTYFDTVDSIPWMLLDNYKFQAWRLESHEVWTNRASLGSYRAPLAVNAAFPLESQLDQLARRLGLDPIVLRLKNLFLEGDLLPPPNKIPQVRTGAKEALTALAEHPAWKESLPRTGKDGQLHGRGVGLGSWGSSRWPSSAVAKLEADGRMQFVLGTIDLTGSYTSLAQIAAETLGVSAERVIMSRANTDHATFASVSGGSGTIYSMGSAVREAALDLRAKMFLRAAEELKVTEPELRVNDEGFYVITQPERTCSFCRLYQLGTHLFLSKFSPLVGIGSFRPQKRAPTYAASLAEVTVDPETGQVYLVKLITAQDVGKAINPLSVEGQIQGGTAQSAGMALWEEIQYSPEGQVLNPNWMDYHMPTAADLPMIEPILLEIPGGDGPYGAKGVGEPPIIPPVVSIANAVADAIGSRICELPITTERVWKALNGKTG